MPVRVQGPDSPAHAADPWVGADVEMWLKAAFRAMPYTGIYAPRGNTLHAVSPDTPDATFDIVAFSGTVLGDRSEDRVLVLTWARSVSSKGSVGGSVA